MSVYECIFNRLVTLGIYNSASEVPPYRRSLSLGYMDLVVERLPYLDNGATERAGCVYSLAHYVEQNGDLCSDPEMTLIVYPESNEAEALSFQQAMPPICQSVYPSPGRVILDNKRDLNAFLATWLNNLIGQDHGRAWAS